MTNEYGTIALKAMMTGKDLIVLGYQPGIEFKEILEVCYDLQLKGKTKEALIDYIRNKYPR